MYIGRNTRGKTTSLHTRVQKFDVGKMDGFLATSSLGFATLVALLFQVDGLNWDKPSDHVETFAGKMACTRAEWEAHFNITVSKLFPKKSNQPQYLSQQHLQPTLGTSYNKG